MSSTSSTVAEGAVGRIALRDIVVDFFGSLVPGMVFILTTVTVLGTSLLALKLAFVLTVSNGIAFAGGMRSIEQASTVLHAFSFAWALLLLMGSYVIGYAFYRRDVRVADRKSFLLLFPAAKTQQEFLTRFKDLFRTKARKKHLRAKLRESRESLKHWVAETAEECDFPYPHLSRYLRDRGLHHLATMVPWQASEQDLTRSKGFINVLKIRLTLFYPERCGTIYRNEAHVRLLSSTWYMSKKIKYPTSVSLGVSILSIVISFANPRVIIQSYPGIFSFTVFSLILSTTVLVIGWLTGRAIEKSLHYQRVQEIVWVLETAYSAFRSHPEKLLDICPGFGSETQLSIFEPLNDAGI